VQNKIEIVSYKKQKNIKIKSCLSRVVKLHVLNKKQKPINLKKIARASGDASRFKQVLVEYRKAPKVTRDRLYIETMEEVLSNNNKVMIDVKKGNNLLYIPIDQIIKQKRKIVDAQLDNKIQQTESSNNLEGLGRSSDRLRSRGTR